MVSNNILLRPAHQDDAEKIAELEAAIFPDLCWNETTIGQELELGTSWVAELDGELVGYALINKIKGIADLLRLGVKAELRGQGVGRRLLEISLGTEPALLMVEQTNPARHLYSALDFKIVGKLENSWVMRRY